MTATVSPALTGRAVSARDRSSGSPSARHDAELAYAALAMAVAVHGGDVTGVLLLHTDGGSEYTSRSFRAACERLGSCSRGVDRGWVLDNAAIKAFHSTLTFELLGLEQFTTQVQARRRVAAWIEAYNRTGGTPRSGCAAPSITSWRARPSFPPRTACRRPRRRQDQALRVACGEP